MYIELAKKNYPNRKGKHSDEAQFLGDKD